MSKLYPKCERCKSWMEQGLSDTCPACDLAEQRLSERALNPTKPKFEVGDKVVWLGEKYKVLGYAASKNAKGVPLIEIAWNNYRISPTGYLAVPEAELSTRGYSYWRAVRIVTKLQREFPGLVDGDTEVNGADLVEFLTNALRGV